MTKTKAAVQQELTVRRRSVNGGPPVNQLRREGFVPGVVYGKGMESLPIAVNQRELLKLLHTKTREQALVTLHLDDCAWSPPGKPKAPNPTAHGGRHPAPPDKSGAPTAGWEKPVLVKEVQHDPVDGRVVHIDFQTIVLTEQLRLRIPLVLKGEAVGVKQDGGILEQFLREVEVECLPTEIPASAEFDVSAMKIGETVHVRDLVPPKNARITSDPDGVIASVQKPKEEKPEEVAAVTEPEVIREKKEEGEAAPTETTKSEPAATKKDAKS